MDKYLARYKKHLFYAFFLILCLHLFTTSTFGKGIHSLFIAIVQLPSRAVYVVSNNLKKRFQNLSSLKKALEENEILKRNIRILQRENTQLRAEIQNYESLAPRLIELENLYRIKTIPCVIFSKSLNLTNIQIYCATRKLQKRQPVINSSGVIGVISYPSGKRATVNTLFNRQFAVDAITLDSRVRGIVKGNTTNIIMDYVSSTSKVKIGEIVVTSGMDGVFPYGISIGRIEKISLDPRKILKRMTIKPHGDILSEPTVITMESK